MPISIVCVTVVDEITDLSNGDNRSEDIPMRERHKSIQLLALWHRGQRPKPIDEISIL